MLFRFTLLIRVKLNFVFSSLVVYKFSNKNGKFIYI
nr:MAG TPA: hypothetical protein [Caudoviricetes sp.]